MPTAVPGSAFDTGLRVSPFPNEIARLLPVLLTASRGGISPAATTNFANKIHRYLSVPAPALLSVQKG
jgi:hypothetical protein